MALQHLDSTLETLHFNPSSLHGWHRQIRLATAVFLAPSEHRKNGALFLLCAGTLAFI
jgi:hypothetical protein